MKTYSNSSTFFASSGSDVNVDLSTWKKPIMAFEKLTNTVGGRTALIKVSDDRNDGFYRADVLIDGKPIASFRTVVQEDADEGESPFEEPLARIFSALGFDFRVDTVDSMDRTGGGE